MPASLPPVEALREIASQGGGTILSAKFLDLPAIDFQRALPEPDQVLRADGQDILDVCDVIGARGFQVEADDSLVARVLEHNHEREVLERLGITEGQVLIV